MRISDWSSDVCSSDLVADALGEDRHLHLGRTGVALGAAMFLDERVLALLRDRHSLSFDIGSKVEPAHDANLAVQNLHQRNRHFAFGRKVLAIVGGDPDQDPPLTERPCLIGRSEEHTSELQSLMRISYAVFCLK